MNNRAKDQSDRENIVPNKMHKIHQNSSMCRDYLSKIKFKNPSEFNTVRLNEPVGRYKSEQNASVNDSKIMKR